MPSGVMFWNDVWTIVTIGQITTNAISATAGPSQGSGSRRPAGAASRPGLLRPGAGGRARLGDPAEVRGSPGDVRHRVSYCADA